MSSKNVVDEINEALIGSPKTYQREKQVPETYSALDT